MHNLIYLNFIAFTQAGAGLAPWLVVFNISLAWQKSLKWLAADQLCLFLWMHCVPPPKKKNYHFIFFGIIFGFW